MTVVFCVGAVVVVRAPYGTHSIAIASPTSSTTIPRMTPRI